MNGCKRFNFLLIISILKIFKDAEGAEDSLKVKIEDIIVEYVNGTYFDADTFDISVNYKTDSFNTMNLQLDIIEELPKDTYIKLIVMGRGFGQYNIPTGVSVDVNICTNKLKEHFFQTLFNYMGWNGECPPKKGSYKTEDFDPNVSGFPIKILPGYRFLIIAESYSESISLVKVKSYVQFV